MFLSLLNQWINLNTVTIRAEVGSNLNKKTRPLLNEVRLKIQELFVPWVNQDNIYILFD